VGLQREVAGRRTVERTDADRHLVGQLVGEGETARTARTCSFVFGNRLLDDLTMAGLVGQFQHIPQRPTGSVHAAITQGLVDLAGDRVPVDGQPNERPVQVVDDGVVVL